MLELTVTSAVLLELFLMVHHYEPPPTVQPESAQLTLTVSIPAFLVNLSVAGDTVIDAYAGDTSLFSSVAAVFTAVSLEFNIVLTPFHGKNLFIKGKGKLNLLAIINQKMIFNNIIDNFLPLHI